MGYNKEYFDWQKTVGEFGGKANLFKFEEYITGNEDILDFGCGGGYLLKNINTTGKRFGVEINPVAREKALENGNYVVENLSMLQENSVDIIISNHALEHVQNPLEILTGLKRVLRAEGKIIMVVPHETGKKVDWDDYNLHLFTWSPQNLYNLFKICGFEVIEAKRISHKWIKHYVLTQKIVGWKIFHVLCCFNSLLRRGGYQTRIVAEKMNV